MIRQDDARSGSGYPVLTVDLQRLPDLARAIQQEIEKNLGPRVDRALSECSAAPCFGDGLTTANARAMTNFYLSCIDQFEGLVSGYETTGQAMAMAADLVAKRYGASDAMAVAQAQDVQDAIDVAKVRIHPDADAHPGTEHPDVPRPGGS